MKTHRLMFKCNSVEFADYLENEILQVDFCDATHWYCGLDGAGEDTPDSCVIFRGIIHPEVVYVEIDLEQNGLTVETLEHQYEMLKQFYSDGDRRIEEFQILKLK